MALARSLPLLTPVISAYRMSIAAELTVMPSRIQPGRRSVPRLAGSAQQENSGHSATRAVVKRAIDILALTAWRAVRADGIPHKNDVTVRLFRGGGIVKC